MTYIEPHLDCILFRRPILMVMVFILILGCHKIFFIDKLKEFLIHKYINVCSVLYYVLVFYCILSAIHPEIPIVLFASCLSFVYCLPKKYKLYFRINVIDLCLDIDLKFLSLIRDL